MSHIASSAQHSQIIEIFVPNIGTQVNACSNLNKRSSTSSFYGMQFVRSWILLTDLVELSSMLPAQSLDDSTGTIISYRLEFWHERGTPDLKACSCTAVPCKPMFLNEEWWIRAWLMSCEHETFGKGNITQLVACWCHQGKQNQFVWWSNNLKQAGDAWQTGPLKIKCMLFDGGWFFKFRV